MYKYCIYKGIIMSKAILNEGRMATDAEKADVIRIIKSHAGDKYADFVTRLAGFTGYNSPNLRDVDSSIDIRPLVRDLVSAGHMSVKNGKYSRSDAVSSAMQKQFSDDRTRGYNGQAPAGSLPTDHYANAKKFANTDGKLSAREILDNAGKGRSVGNAGGNIAKQLVRDTIESRDPAWGKLSADDKTTLSNLNTLTNPIIAFNVLRRLQVLAKVKGSYSRAIKSTALDATPVKLKALKDLEYMGILDLDNATVNKAAIQSLNNVLTFLKAEPIEGIKYQEKLREFARNLEAASTPVASDTHLKINSILKSDAFPKQLEYINSKLTDTVLNGILKARDLSNTPALVHVIHRLATGLNATTADDLRAKLADKMVNRLNHKGDENQKAIDVGRKEEFDKNFRLFDE